MQDRTSPAVQERHPQDNVNTVPAFAEELRRVVATQIGPRRPGVIYDHADVLFQVVAVTADASEARRILKRRAAQFAITVIDLITGDQHVTGAVWTGSDRVLKAVAA
ncbi:hypothetical protein ABZ829_27755 [Streptomyces xanthochromogenes]|uniref:hypothetical protein n=1 Tax=Streptomyces xanthochromogenes TaxID=67384 RepID=UPI003448F40D